MRYAGKKLVKHRVLVFLLAVVLLGATVGAAGCGASGGGSPDGSTIAERYLKPRVVREAKHDGSLRLAAHHGANPTSLAKATTVLCGSKGQPPGTYRCDATVTDSETLLDVGHEAWRVQVSGGRVTSAERLRSNFRHDYP